SIASNSSRNNNDTTSGTNITLPILVNPSAGSSSLSILLGGILILSGILVCLLFMKYIKIAGSIIGFYVWGSLAWILMANSEQPYPGYGDNRDYLYFSVPIFIGEFQQRGNLVLAISFIKKNVSVALGGYAFGITLMSFKDSGFLPSHGLQLAFMSLFGTIGFAIMFLFKDNERIWPLALTSSFCGAYSIILGVDQFLNFGFTAAPVAFVDFNLQHAKLLRYNVNGKVYGLLGSIFVLAAIGFYVQFKIVFDYLQSGSQNPTDYGMRDDLEKITYEKKQAAKMMPILNSVGHNTYQQSMQEKRFEDDDDYLIRQSQILYPTYPQRNGGNTNIVKMNREDKYGGKI
ncbi:8021_t:CDS:2, partial [Acaulospora morrowiae]